MARIKGVIQIILFLLCLYSLLRLAFYYGYFSNIEKTPGFFFRLLYWGMRLDFTALFYINGLFLLYYLFIDRYINRRIGERICLLLLLLLNIPFIAINMIDLAYFRFTGRRSTSDLLFVAGDSLSALPGFIKKYWYLFLFFALAVTGFVVLSKKIISNTRDKDNIPLYKRLLPGVLIIMLFILMARGTGARPVLPSTPLLYFDAELQPLVSNSSFSFLYSMVKRQQQLPPKQYYTKQQLDTLFTIHRQYVHAQPFQRKNVVIFILESFCKEFLQPGPYRAHTPFLDSIIAQSTWCSNAYSNGLMSNQGMVAILGSMPPFLDEPYYHSIYSNNKLRGLGTILKEEGYTTHFFMGAGPDHFGFGKFCKMVGIDNYHSRRDYNNDRHYDGNWGISDHYFLPFGAGVLQKQKQPFLSVFFTLSSHFPYSVPPQLRSRFNTPGQPPYLESAAYVDYSLRLFFDSIKNTSWYTNTLFVFTADHSIIGLIKNNYSPFHIYRIPLFVYDPAHPVYQDISRPVQQTDIVPTILDRLAYSRPFMAFGHSLADTTARYVVYNYPGATAVADSAFLLGFNRETDQASWLYHIAVDTGLKKNLLNNAAYAAVKDRLLRYNKAVVQRYHYSVIHNELFIK